MHEVLQQDAAHLLTVHNDDEKPYDEEMCNVLQHDAAHLGRQNILTRKSTTGQCIRCEI